MHNEDTRRERRPVPVDLKGPDATHDGCRPAESSHHPGEVQPRPHGVALGPTRQPLGKRELVTPAPLGGGGEQLPTMRSGQVFVHEIHDGAPVGTDDVHGDVDSRVL